MSRRSQIFSGATLVITHVFIHGEFHRIIGCRFVPRSGYNSLTYAAAAAARAHKPTAGASFKDAEGPGLRHDAATSAAAIVRALCWSGVEKSISSDKDPGFDALAMFDFLPVACQNRGPGDVVIDEAFDAVVRGYARLKMPDRAAQTFFQLCARGYVPCINTCNFLMNLLVGYGDMKSVEDVYCQIKKRSPQVIGPNWYTFRTMMEALCGQGKWCEAVSLLGEMLEEGIKPDSSICSELIRGLCAHGRPDSGYEILKAASRLGGIHMATINYNHVISGFCRIGEVCEAAEVMADMVTQGVPPDVYTYGSLIRGLCACGYPDLGYKLLKAARIWGIHMTTINYNHVISEFCRIGELCEAEEVLADMVRQGVPPDVYTYGSLIGACCSSCNIRRVLSLLGDMGTRGIKSNCVIVSSILHCFSEFGMNPAVLHLFDMRKDSEEIVDEVLYNIAIDAQCKLGKMEEAAGTFQEMRRCGFVPDKIHYTTLINGYCRKGEIDNARKTFSSMTDAGLKPDVVTYNTLASGFAKRGFVGETLGLLYQMLDHGVEPNSVTYAIVVKSLNSVTCANVVKGLS